MDSSFLLFLPPSLEQAELSGEEGKENSTLFEWSPNGSFWRWFQHGQEMVGTDMGRDKAVSQETRQAIHPSAKGGL